MYSRGKEDMSWIPPTPEINKERILPIKTECNFHCTLGHYFCYVDENEHQIDWLPTPWPSIMPKVLGTFPLSVGTWKKYARWQLFPPLTPRVPSQDRWWAWCFFFHYMSSPFFLIGERFWKFMKIDPMLTIMGDNRGRRTWLIGLKKLTY